MHVERCSPQGWLIAAAVGLAVVLSSSSPLAATDRGGRESPMVRQWTRPAKRVNYTLRHSGKTLATMAISGVLLVATIGAMNPMPTMYPAEPVVYEYVMSREAGDPVRRESTCSLNGHDVVRFGFREAPRLNLFGRAPGVVAQLKGYAGTWPVDSSTLSPREPCETLVRELTAREASTVRR